MNVPAPDTIRSILVLQNKFLGDLILTTALINGLRRHYPHAKITMVCYSEFEAFVLNQGLADAVVPLRRKMLRGNPLNRLREMTNALRTLRHMHFDLSIDVADTRTARALAAAANAPTRVGYYPPEKKLRPFERLPANVLAAPQGPGGAHYLYRYLSPLYALSIPVVDPMPVLVPQEEAMARAKDLLSAQQIAPGAFVAIHAGASFPGRCWQPERFAATIDAIHRQTGLRSVIVGAPDETAIAGQIAAVAASPVASLVGNSSLETLVAILACATAFVGNESGPMHIAGAVGTPVVGLFGRTWPAIWGPVGSDAIALRPSMPCPCINPDGCGKRDSSRVYCVQRLSVGEVIPAVLAHLEAAMLRRPKAS